MTSRSRLRDRLDASKWFNAAWAVAYWTALTGASVFGAIETHGLVRVLLVVLAILFGLVLIYTVLALTIGGRQFRRVVAMIEAERRGRGE